MKDETYKDFVPTLYFPDRCHIVALAEVPANEDHRIRDICLKWARDESNGNEPFLVAFKENDSSFRIVHYRDGETMEHVYPAQVV